MNASPWPAGPSRRHGQRTAVSGWPRGFPWRPRRAAHRRFTRPAGDGDGVAHLGRTPHAPNGTFACPSWITNRALAASTRVHAYEFADRTAPNLYAITPDFPLGAYHGAELAYLFLTQASPLNAAQRRLSGQLLTYWSRFAATGGPNGLGTAHWRRFRPTDPAFLTLDLTRTENGYGFGARHRCAFWATVGGALT